jgi:tetratricopeptide (TPR) repeat protein
LKRILILVLALLMVLPVVYAQGRLTLSSEARAALERGEEKAQEALTIYERHNADFPLWREAIAQGRQALSLAPDHPAPLRFLAEAYSITLWYARAWEMWLRYEAAGGLLDPEARDMLARVGTQLGYLRYERGDLAGALEYYLQVIDRVPQDTEAYVWAGRISLELGQPEGAVPYWQEVLRRDPADSRAAYFLGLSHEQARWGAEAVDAFYEGVGLYEQGYLGEAQLRFASASELNPDYTEAWAWLGRTHFEQGNYRAARRAYRRARDLDPGNETYRYFVQESRRLTDEQ